MWVGRQSSSQTSLLPSQSKLVPICTPGSKGASFVKYGALFKNTARGHTWGSNSQPWHHHEPRSLPLSYACQNENFGFFKNSIFRHFFVVLCFSTTSLTNVKDHVFWRIRSDRWQHFLKTNDWKSQSKSHCNQIYELKPNFRTESETYQDPSSTTIS